MTGAGIDVVTPTFNRPPEMLRNAVQSALASPLIRRIIVVDDGSNTPADTVLKNLDRVEVLRQANAGPSAARNRGLDATTASFVILMDDDDELVAAGLEPMVAIAEKTGASAVLGGREEFKDDGSVKPLPWPAELSDRAWPDRRDIFRPLSALRGGALITRRAATVRFDPGLKLYEDKEYLYRCSEFGPIAACSALAVRVRSWATGENLSSPQHIDRRVVDHLQIAARYPILRDFPGWQEQTRWLLRFYAKHGRDGALWQKLRAAGRECGVSVDLKSRTRWALRSKTA